MSLKEVFMAEAVPFTLTPMAEAPGTDPTLVQEIFARVASGELPGMVIRAAGVEFEGDPIEHMQRIARDAAVAVTGVEHEIGPTVIISRSPDHGHRESGLHADDEATDERPQAYHAHTTPTQEPSYLRLANPGPALQGSGINERYDERLNELFKRGETDPDLVEPVFHEALASDYDTAVFRVSGPKPTWHDVTTPQGSRISAVSTLLPVAYKRAVAPPSFDISGIG